MHWLIHICRDFNEECPAPLSGENTWSPVGVSVGEGSGDTALLRRSVTGGSGWVVRDLQLKASCHFLFSCHFCFVLVFEDMSPHLTACSCHHACSFLSHLFTMMDFGPSTMVSQDHHLPWPWCSITATETLTRTGSVAFLGICHFEVLKSHAIPSSFCLQLEDQM